MTNEERKVFELALEALLKTQNEGFNLPGSAIREAITTIKEALAQPVQEPVAWAVIASNTGRICQVELNFAEVEELSPKWVVPLYTTPPQRKPPEAGDGSELFYKAVRLLDNAIFAQCGDVVRHDSAAHREALDFFNNVFTWLDMTPPPQRKPLSLHELSKIFASIPSIPFDGDWQLELVRAIEAAHGIKE